MSTDVSILAKKIIENVEQVVVGKRPTVTLVIVAALSEGHVLLEDVPGVAKTMLARALAKSLNCNFKRLQCTPDLLPTDVTGVSVFNPKTTEFEFRPGPIFAQILLVDEINRTTPRTQSALLEAMAERRVTVDGQTYNLKPPFMVLATQNPVDHDGTFPLPEAQLDRFLVRLSLGYPSKEHEAVMLDRQQKRHPIDDLKPIVESAELLTAQETVRSVFVDEKVRGYVLDMVHGTREHEDVALGASPRASIALYRTAQALAAIRGRDFVLPDDVKKMAPAVLAHRLILKPEARLRRQTVDAVVKEVVMDTRVPVMQATDARDEFRD